LDKFRLSERFIEQYEDKKPPFGFNGLGEITYLRTYSRIKSDGSNEQWWETCQRVVNGTYNMQKRHIDENGLGWNAYQAQKSAQEMYDRMFNMKFLPPGRGIWGMGSLITEEKHLYAALNNCSFISTENIKEEPSKPFLFMMDMSMLGVGVGFDTKGVGLIEVKGPNKKRSIETFKIPDSREGWVESLRLLLDAYFLGTGDIEFDYSDIRKAGEPIKTFGGISSGADPLVDLHKNIRLTLNREIGQQISTTAIVDLMNHIGVCVVSGNVRRSAQISVGDYKSDEYLKLKDYHWDDEKKDYIGSSKHRAGYGWTSNNSIFADLGMNYKKVATQTAKNGEPGYVWLENMKAYSRINNGPDWKDKRVAGPNPCVEQSLESYELCTLVETFPNNHENLEDFLRTLKFAYLYAKTVTLGKTHWAESNRVMLRNRRIGCSMSGIAQIIEKRGINEFKEWCQKGYDEIQKWDEVYSDWLAIPKSKKCTSVKPSGTTSLLAGATPGMHYPESRFYIRRIRISQNSQLLKPLEKAGYHIEPASKEVNTVIVSIPIDIGEIRSVKQVSMWEQLSLAAFLQKYWTDNQVSATIRFDPETEGNQIEYALNYFQYQLKGVSFLPNTPKGAYAQMPYEEIDEKTFKELSKGLKKPQFAKIKGEEAETDKYCNNDVCEIPLQQ